MNRLVSKLRIFLEMIKFEHSIFALPFAYLGLFLAENGWPGGHIFLWVTVAMVSFRTMAMGLNRIIDAHIDSENPRTKNRAIPAGKLKTSFVWGITFLSFFIFEWSTFQLNMLCFQLSCIPVFLAWFYPLSKRFTWLSHFLLGFILGIAPYGAWLASRMEFSWIPGLLTLGVTCWVAGFDIIYALQDVDFDKQTGLHSFPAKFSEQTSLRITRVLHGIAVMSWFLAGVSAGLGAIYLIGLILVIFFLIRENWLMKKFGLRKVQEAFFAMNAVVSISLFAAVLMDISFRGALS